MNATEVNGKKVYISGQITGLDQMEALKKFGEAERMLEDLGATPFNPLCFPKGFSWEDYMEFCKPVIRRCNLMYMLDNWKTSKGAKIEHEWARAAGIPIIHQEGKG